MKTAIVTGASSGLGRLIAKSLKVNYDKVYNWDRANGVDVSEKESVERAARANTQPVDVLVNCAGINHIEWLPNLKEEDWDRVMNVNAKGIFLTSQALLHRLKGGTILNIVSNASHMPMTTSLAYNASKGAAHIMSAQLARELKKTHDITVFAISPNKLKGTGMSEYIDSRVVELRGWTEEQARSYQLAALPAGEETDPAVLAEFVGFLLSSKERHQALAGCDIPYGA